MTLAAWPFGQVRVGSEATNYYNNVVGGGFTTVTFVTVTFGYSVIHPPFRSEPLRTTSNARRHQNRPFGQVRVGSEASNTIQQAFTLKENGGQSPCFKGASGLKEAIGYPSFLRAFGLRQ